jgi:RNA polymerase sigma factor (sigma-70 family)
MGVSKDYQTKLFPYAYNILGSIDDANDVIQDVIIDFVESNRDDIKHEAAYLIKSVINKSINLKKRNQKMVGQTTWLPDPIATETADKKINSQEIITYSMLVLLEYLGPRERAVFILKQVFDYSHREIAEIFSISIENSKQLLSRAKKVLKEKGSDFKLKNVSTTDSLMQYVNLIRNGDIKMLEEMLSDHISVLTGGAGRGAQGIQLIVGIDAVAQLIVDTYDRYLRKFQIEIGIINHAPALLFYKGDRLLCCQVIDIDIDSHKINTIYFIAGRQKMKNLQNN